MISERHDIDAVRANLVEEVRGNSTSPGDIFGVGDHQIDPMLAAERRERTGQRLASRLTEAGVRALRRLRDLGVRLVLGF